MSTLTPPCRQKSEGHVTRALFGIHSLNHSLTQTLREQQLCGRPCAGVWWYRDWTRPFRVRSASRSLLPNIPAWHLNLLASPKAANPSADSCHQEEVLSLGPHCSSSFPSLGQHKAELL